MEDALSQLIESWRINNRVNLFLIDKIDADGMRCTLSKRGGRNVVRQFAHIHNVRFWHLEKRARDLAAGLHEYETADEPDKRLLKKSLNDSALRLEQFIEDCVAGKPRRRPFKRGIIPFVGYLIAHESHHRGNILLTLKQSGHNLGQPDRYAIWDWDRI